MKRKSSVNELTVSRKDLEELVPTPKEGEVRDSGPKTDGEKGQVNASVTKRSAGEGARHPAQRRR